MNVYGSNIVYSTTGAPVPITGICENFSYKHAETLTEVIDIGEIAALIAHGKKGSLSFSSTPLGTVAALGVRAGAELTISAITGGKVIVTTSDAKWQRGQPMKMSAQANHYPDITAAGSGSTPPQAFSLSNGTGAVVLPTSKVWWGTSGITGPVAGIVQSCSISESVQVQEEEDNAGKITAVITHSYKATGSIEVITDAAIPDVGGTLDIFGSFKITSAEEKWAKGQVRMIMVEGILVPGVTS